jgi:hypothetical protein
MQNIERKYEEKRTAWESGRMREDNIKMDVKEKRSERLYWIHLAQE